VKFILLATVIAFSLMVEHSHAADAPPSDALVQDVLKDK